MCRRGAAAECGRARDGDAACHEGLTRASHACECACGMCVCMICERERANSRNRSRATAVRTLYCIESESADCRRGAADAKQSAFMTSLAFDFMFKTLSENAKQIKQEQAQLQSDAVEMDSWIPSDGITMAGTSAYTSDMDSGMSYSFGDLGQLDLERDLFNWTENWIGN